MSATATDTPSTETPEPETTPEPELGFILILEEIPDALPNDNDGGSIPPRFPRPPATPRKHGDGRPRRNDRFWRLIGWLALLLLAFAIGGAIGEIGNKILRPAHPEE